MKGKETGKENQKKKKKNLTNVLLFNISLFEDESRPKSFQTDQKQDDSYL